MNSQQYEYKRFQTPTAASAMGFSSRRVVNPQKARRCWKMCWCAIVRRNSAQLRRDLSQAAEVARCILPRQTFQIVLTGLQDEGRTDDAIRCRAHPLRHNVEIEATHEALDDIVTFHGL